MNTKPEGLQPVTPNEVPNAPSGGGISNARIGAADSYVDNTPMVPRNSLVSSSMPGIMNTKPKGLQPVTPNKVPNAPSGGGISNAEIDAAAGLAGGLVSIVGKPGGKGTGAASGALDGAAAGAALGPIGMGVGALVGGVTGFLGAEKAQKQQRMVDQQKEREQYRAGTANMNPQGSVYASNGGSLGREFGGITPRLTTFNEGGTHEQNPNSGIAQGIAADGQPNLVEQNETKFKDYIYSARLPLLDAREYNLPKNLSGKTFADASKKISKSIEERPNDPIAKAGQDSALNRLKTANDDAIEMKKFTDENEQFKCGGKMKMAKHKFEYGGYTFNDI
jgi:hypothetical protein